MKERNRYHCNKGSKRILGIMVKRVCISYFQFEKTGFKVKLFFQNNVALYVKSKYGEHLTNNYQN